VPGGSLGAPFWALSLFWSAIVPAVKDTGWIEETPTGAMLEEIGAPNPKLQQVAGCTAVFE
jgi:hypothetical protein